MKVLAIGTTIAVVPILYSVAFVELITSSGGSHASMIVAVCVTDYPAINTPAGVFAVTVKLCLPILLESAAVPTKVHLKLDALQVTTSPTAVGMRIL